MQRNSGKSDGCGTEGETNATVRVGHSRRHLLRAAAGGGAALLAGCTLPVRGPAVPRGEVTQASVLGLPNERFFPSHGTEAMSAEVVAAVQRQQRLLGLAPDDLPPQTNILAVSGGGENGAFGAGLLCGWSEAGDRPTFFAVTGVSTGALTAPFAFLGTAYDDQLRAVYTDLEPADVLKPRGLIFGALFSDAMADNLPLYKTISGYLTTEMQTAIAKGYAEGRLLWIATTDLDAQVPVIWNIGAIAASDHPRALDTIRRVLLASAAIPGAFPPSMVDVTLNGVAYQEMHVDGGAFAQVFLYPPSLTRLRRERMRQGKPVPDVEAYVIRNARLDPDWAGAAKMMSVGSTPPPRLTASATIWRLSALTSPRCCPSPSTQAICARCSTMASRKRATVTTGRSIPPGSIRDLTGNNRIILRRAIVHSVMRTQVGIHVLAPLLSVTSRNSRPTCHPP
jgi:Patatin-like phospholipase